MRVLSVAESIDRGGLVRGAFLQRRRRKRRMIRRIWKVLRLKTKPKSSLIDLP